MSALLIWTMAVSAAAASGDLDPTFGAAGRVIYDTGDFDLASGVAVQGDGKVVVAGQGPNALLRFDSGGTLDPTFGDDGVVAGGPTGSSTNAFDLALQDDGGIVVAGSRYSGGRRGRDFWIARHDSNGVADATFGSEGTVLTDFGIGHDEDVYMVSVEPDGKIVAAGIALTGSGWHYVALARYLPDGTLDSEFGSGGLVLSDLGSDGLLLHGAAVQPDGKIVVTVSRSGGGTLLVRYTKDGELDSGFGVTGVVDLEELGFFYASAIAVQEDGRILTTGAGVVGDAWRSIVARFNSDGTPDLDFASDGIVSGPEDSQGEALTIQPDGKIVLGGWIAPALEPDFLIARYNSDGGADSSFGVESAVTTDMGADDRIEDVAVADGHIVAAGGTFDGELGSTWDVALARYLGRSSGGGGGGGGKPKPSPTPEPSSLPAPAPTETPEPLQYVALGDSYSSGEGVEPFDNTHSGQFTETDEPRKGDSLCHRSKSAYARQVGEALGLDTLLFACSGARIEDLRHAQEHTQRSGRHGRQVRVESVIPQLDHLNGQTDLVSITIGGNDLDFAKVVKRCKLTFRCDKNTNFGGIGTQQPRLVKRYLEILGPDRASNATLFVLGYPQIFPSTESVRLCEGGDFSGAERGWLRDMTIRLNSMIAGAVRKTRSQLQDPDRIEFVNVLRAFDGHEVCTGRNAWVNGTSSPLVYSFHPNAQGQSRLADLLVEKMSSLD